MEDQAPASREQVLEDAWKRWFERDFSWDGLLSLPCASARFGSLQTYWLNDPAGVQTRTEDDLRAAGELVDARGQKSYHLAHLPLHYADGSPTLKTHAPHVAGPKLEEIIRTRLRMSTRDPETPDLARLIHAGPENGLADVA